MLVRSCKIMIGKLLYLYAFHYVSLLTFCTPSLSRPVWVYTVCTSLSAVAAFFQAIKHGSDRRRNNRSRRYTAWNNNTKIRKWSTELSCKMLCLFICLSCHLHPHDLQWTFMWCSSWWQYCHWKPFEMFVHLELLLPKERGRVVWCVIK